MIVTADPQGDYTTTLQMLRYSALASEVTVPRVASNRVVSASGGIPPLAAEPTKNPTAAADDPEEHPFVVDNELITRLVTRLEETEALFRKAEDARKSAEKQCTEALQRLVLAKQRTKEAELRAKEAEDQALQTEVKVREELSAEFERREKALFRAYLKRIREEEEAGRDFVDRKVELAMRGLGLDGGSEERDDEDGSGEDEADEVWDRVEMLQEENEVLRREMGKLRRIIAGAGTPSSSEGKAGLVGDDGGKRGKSEQSRKTVAFDQ